MNFVFDTNVLISAALLKGSITDQALEKARRLGKILISGDVYTELKEVIYRSKFDKYLQDIDRKKILAKHKSESLLIAITYNVNVCRYPADDMFLELSLSGKADCIVTSDPDLLILNPFENIRIITPKEFLEKF